MSDRLKEVFVVDHYNDADERVFSKTFTDAAEAGKYVWQQTSKGADVMMRREFLN